MICFFSERSRSPNVGLMLGQCNRRQDNIKYTLSSAWRFCEWWRTRWRRTQSCWCHHRMCWCSRSSIVYCWLVTAVYHWNMFGKIAKKKLKPKVRFITRHSVGARTISSENRSVCRVWQPTDRPGRPIVTCVGVSFDAWLWSQLTICVPMWIIIIWTICKQSKLNHANWNILVG